MPSRRRLLQTLGAVAAAGAGGWALLSGSRANAYYTGPASDHFDGVRFFNPSGVRPRGPGAFLKWQLGDRGEAWPRSFPSPFSADRPPARFDGEGLRITYVGHATFLIQARGKSILIDPVWSERASPVSFAGPKRVNPPGIDFDHLPAIDAVLVTHNHYDHMDVDTIGGLWQRFRPRIVTPLGNDAILKKSVPGLVADDLFGTQSLYALLKQRSGFEMGGGEGTISVSTATAEEASLLGLRRDAGAVFAAGRHVQW